MVINTHFTFGTCKIATVHRKCLTFNNIKFTSNDVIMENQLKLIFP